MRGLEGFPMENCRPLLLQSWLPILDVAKTCQDIPEITIP